MQTKATNELRSRLRFYPVERIASVANMEADRVAAFMDGGSFEPSLEDIIRLTGAEVALRDDNDCTCPVCMLAKQEKGTSSKSTVPREMVCVIFEIETKPRGFFRRLVELFSRAHRPQKGETR